MWSIAIKTLLADRGKLFAALVGVVFSVVLVNIQGGLFLGLIRKASTLVDHGQSDIWVGHHKMHNLMPFTIYGSLNALIRVAAGQRFVKRALLSAQGRPKDALAFFSEDFFLEKTGYPFSRIIPHNDFPIVV